MCLLFIIVIHFDQDVSDFVISLDSVNLFVIYRSDSLDQDGLVCLLCSFFYQLHVVGVTCGFSSTGLFGLLM